ncbi:MAG: lysine--tRNA ligase [Clostridia bacterium]|nr:lysine--tRNA ligase [Clostridia bacterium]
MVEEKNTVLTEEQQARELSEQRVIRRDKLAALRAAGQDPFEQVKYEKTALSDELNASFEEREGSEVSVAGRILARRIMGKASFATIRDGGGNIQLYFRRDDVGEEAYARFKALDIGDIIGVKGVLFRTKTGEISIHVYSYELLSKSLIPLPEKFHGLRDVDLRYRQRYLDLIMNEESRQTFKMRSKMVTALRAFMDEEGFMEVETPILQTEAGGATARPFITHHNTLDIDMYLRIATELHLKRLIIGGFEKVYEIGRIFRNEGMDATHNPEFTTIELYQAYTDVFGILELTERIVRHLAIETCGTAVVTVGETEIDLGAPFRRATMRELVAEKTGVDVYGLSDEEAREACKKLGIEEITADMSRGKCLVAAFEAFVEDTLVQPTFVLDHPVEVSPLAKRRADDPMLTQRFELFIDGHEIANAFSELNDPIDQYDRFVEQAKARAAGDEEAQMMDKDFVTAMEYGMPPTGGMGMGIDRLCMLFTGRSTIRDVVLFPTMKPIE